MGRSFTQQLPNSVNAGPANPFNPQRMLAQPSAPLSGDVLNSLTPEDIALLGRIKAQGSYVGNKNIDRFDPEGVLRQQLGVSPDYKINQQIEGTALAQKLMGPVDEYTQNAVRQGLNEFSQVDPQQLLAQQTALARRRSGIEDVLAAQLSSANSQANPLAARRAQFASALAQQKAASDSQTLGAQMAAQEQARRDQMRQGFANQLLALEDQRRESQANALQAGFNFQRPKSRSFLEKWGGPIASTVGAVGGFITGKK